VRRASVILLQRVGGRGLGRLARPRPLLLPLARLLLLTAPLSLARPTGVPVHFTFLPMRR